MKVIEIINFNRELLKKLQEASVRLEDVQYVEFILGIHVPDKPRRESILCRCRAF